MNNRFTNEPEFMAMPVIGIVRNISMSEFSDVLPAYYESGLRNIEVTMNTEGATAMIRLANKQFGKKLIVGAGTVCTHGQLQAALDAGARFVVTPVLDESIIASCIDKKIPVIPGAFTPTEIYKAWTAGASLVKLFPATSLGTQYISDIKGPLHQIELMPTGGITHNNIASYFEAGASAAGVGSKLFDTTMIREKNWSGLLRHFTAFVRAVSDACSHAT